MNPPDQPTLAPTPRTDAEQWETVDEVRCFARTLERELTETERLRFGADADRRRLRAQLAAIEEDGTEEHNAAVGLRQKLVAVLDRAEKAEADNAYWQKLLLMSRDDREIDLISEIEEQARLLGMSGEREADLSGKLGRLESELAAIKNGHGELGKYEQLRLKNAELQRDKARLDWLAVSDTWFDYPATESFNPETFRDAIDAAMKGTP
jgi:hypothetical protein